MLMPILETGRVAEEFKHIRESIPEEILRVATSYMQWPIEHIQLAECNPTGYLHLAEQNPALLNHLASLSAEHTLWGAQHWGRLLGKPQRHIALQSELDPKMVKYLSRVRDEGLLTHGYLSFAISAWRQIGMARLLAHVKCINLEVILLALNDWDVVRDCPSLLHIAADQAPMSTTMTQAVSTITCLNRQARRPSWRWRKINSIEHLTRIRDVAMAQAVIDGRSDSVIYPSPPISPCSEWTAITTSRELLDHAHKHKNCVIDQAWKLMHGLIAIYETRATAPHDSTIVVLAKDKSAWVVQDVLGTQNALVDPHLEENIRREFVEALSTDCIKSVHRLSNDCGKGGY